MDDTTHTTDEFVIKGIAAAPGIAMGPAYLYTKQVRESSAKPISPDEWKRKSSG